MNRKRPKVLQVRATLKDTRRRQDELFELLRRKIHNNSSLSPDERKIFSGLTSEAMLSQAFRRCYYTAPDDKRIDLGSIRFLCLNLLDVTGNRINIVEPLTGKKYTVSIKEIWQILYNKCKETSQAALREALKMSKELPKREEPTSLDYSSED